MKKIVVAHRFEPGEEALAIMREVARVVILESDSEELLLKEIKDADALLVGIHPRVTRELIGSAPRLKHVARQGVGVDIVDLAAATERGILVTNVPDVTSDSVAEFAMTLLLSPYIRRVGISLSIVSRFSSSVAIIDLRIGSTRRRNQGVTLPV